MFSDNVLRKFLLVEAKQELGNPSSWLELQHVVDSDWLLAELLLEDDGDLNVEVAPSSGSEFERGLVSFMNRNWVSRMQLVDHFFY